MRAVAAGVLIAATMAAPAAAAQADRLERDRAELVEWLSGSFDSTAQWLAAGREGADVPRLHVVVEPRAESSRELTVRVSRWEDGAWRDGFPVALRFDVEPGLDAILMQAADRNRGEAEGAADDPASPPCGLVWHREGAAFVAAAPNRACDPWPAELARAAGTRLDRSGLVLTRRSESEVETTGTVATAAPLRLSRCARYRGEVSIPGRPPVELEIHDQGETVPIPSGGDPASPRSLRLASFPPPSDPNPALRLELLDGADVTAVAVTEPGAERIGLEAAGVRVDLERSGAGGGGLDRLVEWMTGSFSSAPQAEADPEFRDVRLQMAQLWTDRDDGGWLYVEQAVAEYLDRPYRQRVYHVTEIAPGLYQSQVLTLPDPDAAIGAWRDPSRLGELSPDDLEEREGCAILLRRRGGDFVGSTLGSLCRSTLRGAVYATSEVEISAEGIVSWDRGFDRDGHQVWGAEKGGYVFERVAVPEAGPETGSDVDPTVGSQG